MAEDYFTPEELHPDLVGSLRPGGLGLMLHHKFVVDVCYTPIMNKIHNRTYLTVREEAAKAKAEGRWSMFVFWHQRPYRLEALVEIADSMTDQAYWSLARDVWQDTEFPHSVIEIWSHLLGSERPERQHFMGEDERKRFAELPETFMVYRGYDAAHPTGKYGLSYTLDHDKAVWFSKRFAANPKVFSRRIRKEQAIAFLDGRHEDEIVLHPSYRRPPR